MSTPHALLLPYQRRWVLDKSRRKMWLKGRQIGASWATMLEVCDECMEPGGGDWLVLSAGERQAKKLARTLVGWVRAYDAALSALLLPETGEPWRESEMYCPSIADKVTVLEITFRNGKTVTFVPANPDTARGWSANVVADEFAFHKDAEAIMRAVGPSTLRGGYRMIVLSTPNGKQGLFYELFTASNDWSKHLTSLSSAIEQGLNVSFEAMCDLLNNDPDSIAQELEGSFLDSASQFIGPDLITFAESERAAQPIRFSGWEGPGDERRGALLSESQGKPRINGDMLLEDFNTLKALVERLEGELTWGLDIARKRDLSVLWVNKRETGPFLNAELPVLIAELFRVSFDSQFAVIQLIAGKARRGCIDMTGIGAQLAESGERHFPGRVEGITFTGAIKETLAWRLRNKLSDTTARLPVNRSIRESFKSIKKIVTNSGHDRFDADRTEASGHADAFWADALALHAADQPVAQMEYQSTGKRSGLSAWLHGGRKKDERFPQRDLGRQRPANSRTAGF